MFVFVVILIVIGLSCLVYTRRRITIVWFSTISICVHHLIPISIFLSTAIFPTFGAMAKIQSGVLALMYVLGGVAGAKMASNTADYTLGVIAGALFSDALVKNGV